MALQALHALPFVQGVPPISASVLANLGLPDSILTNSDRPLRTPFCAI
jgi:hypothetical protein